MSQPQISIPLDIEDVKVLAVDISQREAIHIKVESSLNYAYCQHCGRKLTKVHEYGDWVKVRHLPILGRAVLLFYRPKRYECPDCEGHPTTTQQLVWHDANSPHTKAYEEHVLRMLVNSTVQDVSTKERLSYESVWGIVERRLASQVVWSDYHWLGTLGVDEIARHKGHQDFVCIVSARLPDGHVSILAMLPNRKKETLLAFFESIPPQLRATIENVCSDLYEGYLQAAQSALPRARRVIDRFHIAKLYRAAADKVRKAELRRLKQTLPAQQYQTLKGSLWVFRKTTDALNEEERQVLDRLFALSSKLKTAYTLREELTTIFETALGKNSAKRQLRQWEAKVQAAGLACFDSFRKTLHRFWNEIINYFIDLKSSGFVEGLNNKIKVLKRRCYGLFNLDHFFQLIWLDLEGYRLFS
ncbi:MAG: ISL3 family transposase [Anaerolineae bacterium]|nr:ISL3 family transposase [Anaerolineae bacterium]